MSRSRVRAVVWAATETLPEALVVALDRQSITWEIARGPFDAASRMLARRDSVGRVLLLVNDPSLRRVAEVRRTIERFDPVAACWTYEDGASPRLTPAPPLDAPAEPEVVVRRGPAAVGASLRLSGTHEAEPETGESDGLEHAGLGNGEYEPDRAEDEAPAPSSVLTPEELTMLLAEEDGERRG